MGQSYSKFNSSSDLVNYLKTQLQKAGFEIKFEDLFGKDKELSFSIAMVI